MTTAPGVVHGIPEYGALHPTYFLVPRYVMSNGTTHPLHVHATAVLSFIGGFVDSAGVLCLFGLMPAHITGYLVTAGQSYHAGMATVGAHHPSPTALIAVFGVSVVATTLAHRWLSDRLGRGHAPSLMLCACSLSGLALLALTYGPEATGPGTRATMLLAAAAVTCMAVQNTLLRIASHGLPPTTVMTGNAVQVLVDATELLTESRAASRTAERKERIVRYGTPLAGFCLGIVAGSIAAALVGPRCFMLPALGASVLAGVTWRREAKDGVPVRLGKREKSRRRRSLGVLAARAWRGLRSYA